MPARRPGAVNPLCRPTWRRQLFPSVGRAATTLHGSGIASYDIFVSDDNGPWQLWQNQTTQTSALFAGQLGQIYAFYSVATDNVGNQEVKTPVIEAQTQTPAVQVNLSEAENAAAPASIKIATLLTGSYKDPDGSKNTDPGIAVIGMAGDGLWQYSPNGSSWTTIVGVSVTQALLLPGGDSLRFMPAANWSGPASLLFLAWDGSQGKAGGVADVSSAGDTTPFSADAGTLQVTVNPTPIWVGTGAALPAIVSNTSFPAGNLVPAVFGNYFHDDNLAVSVGVAIVGATGTASGTWEYSTDGTKWTTFGTPKTTFGILSARNALLLSSGDQLRFVPNAGFAGTATLQAEAWDGTQGAPAVFGATKGYKIAASAAAAFSPTQLTVNCVVNDAPVLGATTGPTLPTAVEGVASTVTVSTLVNDAEVSNVNTKAVEGIAVVNVGGAAEWPGVWKYSLNGVSWTTLPSVSEASAFLLPSTASLQFVPAVQLDGATPNGAVTLTYRAWDQTAGTAATLFAVTATGEATSISNAELTAKLPVILVNHAPTWGGKTAALPTEVSELPRLPATPPVTNVFAAASSTTWMPQQPRRRHCRRRRRSSNAAEAEAAETAETAAAAAAAAASRSRSAGVTGTAGGTWEFSTDGTNWTTFGTTNTKFGVPSASNALLLSASDQIEFVPNAGVGGTATLLADAWDGTQGTAAASGATTGFRIPATGAANAFSSTQLTVSCLVNDAPVLSAATGPSLPTATEGLASTVTVTTLIHDAQISDPDANALQGIAIVNVDVGGAAEWPGTWKYSLNGVSWTTLPSVSESSAFLLPGTASLQFVPTVQLDSATLTPATLTYRAWDQTAGTPATLFAVTATAGTTSISSAELTAKIPVIFVNHAPTWVGSGASFPVGSPGITPLTGSTVMNVFGAYFNDADGNNVGVAIVEVGATGTAGGTWEYSTDGTHWTTFGTTKTAFGVPSSANALLLSANDQIIFVPNSGFGGTATLQADAWDGTQGTAAVSGATKGFNIAATGGTTAFSAKTLTAACLVNTAPTLSKSAVSLTAIKETVTSPAMTASSLLTDAQYTHPNGPALPAGIAVIGDAGPGTWQWLNGKTWTALPSVSSSAAFLLPGADSLRFQPFDNLAGPTPPSAATLTYLGWDQTAGIAGMIDALIGTGGGTSAFSKASTPAIATLPVSFVPQAPTWAAGISASFTPVLGFPAVNPSLLAGDTVAAVFGNAFRDAAGALVGIGISAQNTMSAGAWQYFANGMWNTIPTTVSAHAPLLLSASTKIRFLASTNFSGTVSLTAYAWDGTTGNATSLSATSLKATCLVNTAPTLT